MSAIDIATKVIQGFEGCRLEAYKDSGGIWTVGWGAVGPGVKQGTTWTQQQADHDLNTRIAAIYSILKGGGFIQPILNDNQMAALISLCYNIGQGAFRGSTLIRRINQRDFQAAALEFLKWDYIGVTPNAGLLARRKAESALFLS